MRQQPVFTSEACTRGVRVHVESNYSAERSDPERGQWFFTYHITITNEGPQTVQLLMRHWTITDANGKTEQITGPGVIGEQPVLRPGESFEYTSGCPLRTPVGSMQGRYLMLRRDTEQTFEADIAPFTLAERYTVN
ncbi:MAG: Co2+/Mg2+ efflux protein ApaG [Gammaproteobacteria bacterium]|nr:Co2+/Mg2+ efflux protein ApaG [Gammaproteobacteria bacterium]